MNNSDLRMNVAIAIRNAMQPPVVSELDMPEPFRQHYLDIADAAIRATIEHLADEADAVDRDPDEPFADVDDRIYFDVQDEWLTIPEWLRAHLTSDPEAGAAT